MTQDKHQKSPRVAVIGCGNWGKNLVRNFNSLGHLAAICDLDESRLSEIRGQYKEVLVTNRYEDILLDDTIDAVVVSTPSHTHYRLVKAGLLANKHVYVEKPVATTVVETEELKALSQRVGHVLMVGHLLLYHPAVNRLKQLIAEGYLGDIRYIESDRLNFNPYRSHPSVMWDLAPHDVSMMMFVLEQPVQRVVSVQASQTGDDGLVDIVHIELEFEGGVSGHIHNSWVDHMKQVKLIVRGSEKTAVLDDTAVGEAKLQVFGNDTPLEKETPEYLTIEPLKLECQHFINCIAMGKQPKSDGDNGLEVVRTLEEAERKMKPTLVSLP